MKKVKHLTVNSSKITVGGCWLPSGLRCPTNVDWPSTNPKKQQIKIDNWNILKFD